MPTLPAPQAQAADAAGPERPACTYTTAHQLARLVRQHYDAELGAIGLRATQYRLLVEILAHGPVRPCDLAERMSLSPSTLTRNLKPLIAAGWVDLGPGLDGRTRSVCITAAGRGKCAEGRPRWSLAQAKVHRLIGSRQVGALHALVGQCLTSMSAAAE
ncbi:MarR family winged helix-turn-helix transcriptional regulator [Variovorax paradoxus]|uniref:MarR family winged helix-turn-helix transcriptional regulator n=1 Tax=Variovorax paradoxus TaxID=34073 RepID=UPI0007856DBF|nr:MarR family winged helix-turn-helix transcriptional regulator [Variovorax paradoxus]